MARVDTVVLEVAGHQLDRWVAYRVDSNLLTPADSFWLQVEVPNADRSAVLARVAKGALVKVYLERRDDSGATRRALQMTGVIDKRSLRVTKQNGTLLTVEGRDLAGLLVDSDIEPWLVTEESTVFLDVVRAAVAKWGIEVISDDSAERSILTGERSSRRRTALERREARAHGIPPTRYSRAVRERAAAAGTPLDTAVGATADSGARFASGLAPSDIERLRILEARPRIGDKVWEYLSRHASRLGLMLWFTADGRLVVGAPDYGQEPLYRLIRREYPDSRDPNRIMEGGLEESIANRFSEVTVYGHGSGQDETRTRFRAVSADGEWPAQYDKPRFIKDNGARSDEACARRAERELSLGRRENLRLSYVVDGHGQGDVLWAQGTMAYVEDEPLEIRGNFFVIGRTFKGDRDSGTTTQVELIEPGSLVL